MLLVAACGADSVAEHPNRKPPVDAIAQGTGAAQPSPQVNVSAEAIAAREAAREAYHRLFLQHEGHLTVSLDEHTGMPTYLAGQEGLPVIGGPDRKGVPHAELARRDIVTLAPLFQQRRPLEDFHVIADRKDNGRSHIFYEQRIDGIEVFGGQIAFHYDPEGQLTSAFANLVPEPEARDVIAAHPVAGKKAVLVQTDAGEMRLGRWEDRADALVAVDLVNTETILTLPKRLDGEHHQVYSTWADDGRCAYGVHEDLLQGCSATRLSGCCASAGDCIPSCDLSPHAMPLCPVIDDQSADIPASLPQPAKDWLQMGKSQLAAVYQHFHQTSVADLDSFDGAGHELAVFIDCNPCAASAYAQNILKSVVPKYLVFCATNDGQGNFIQGIDVAGHEFGHHMLGSLVPGPYGLHPVGDGKAMHEGLADVLGLMVEADVEDAPMDWVMGEVPIINGVRRIGPSSPVKTMSDGSRCVRSRLCLSDSCTQGSGGTIPCSDSDYTYGNSHLVSHTFYRMVTDSTNPIAPVHLERILVHAIRNYFLGSMTYERLRLAVERSCEELNDEIPLPATACSVVDAAFLAAGYGEEAIGATQMAFSSLSAQSPSFRISPTQPFYRIQLALDPELFSGSSGRDEVPPGRNFFQTPFLPSSANETEWAMDLLTWQEFLDATSIDWSNRYRGAIYYRIVTAQSAVQGELGVGVKRSSPNAGPAPFIMITGTWPNGTLVEDDATKALSLFEAGTRRAIPGGRTGAVFQNLRYRASHIVKAFHGMTEMYPVGAPVESPGPGDGLDLFRSDRPGVDPTFVWAVWTWRDALGARLRRHVASEEVFASWGFTNLASIPIDNVKYDAFPKQGPPLLFRDGSLVREASRATVYVISDSRRIPIPTAEVFLALGYQWSNVAVVPDGSLDVVAGSQSQTLGAQSVVASGALDFDYIASGPPLADPVPPRGYVQRPFTCDTVRTGCEPLTGASVFKVYWSAEDQTSGLEAVDIQYTLDGWQTVTPMNAVNLMALPHLNDDDGDGRSAVGLFDWQVPDVDTSAAAFRILMWDKAGNFFIDYTDPFAIISTGMGGACFAPDTPYLTEPGVSSPSGNYPVTWLASSGAEHYVLEESTSPSFTAPTSVTLSGTSRSVSGKTNGTYYYRVKATNECGESGWSETRDMVVSINQPPIVPSAPSPADGSIGVSRTPLLTWSGSDPEGPVEFAVRFGTDPGSLGFAQAFGPSQSVSFGSPLEPGVTYYWQVRARDTEGIVTEGPLWRFTTAHAYPDLVASTLDVLGTIAPDAPVTLQLTVQNQGAFASLPCTANFYLGKAPGAKEVQFFGGSATVPALAPGAATLVSVPTTLEELTAGTSYVVAEVNTVGIFSEAVLSNNQLSKAINYTDDNAPVIDSLVLRWGIGPNLDQFQTGHGYHVYFEVHDDVGIGCKDFDLYYSGDGGISWSPIVLGQAARRFSNSDFYDWTIPAGTPLTTNAFIRLVARDDEGNSSFAVAGPYQIIDGTGPTVAVTSPNGGETWNLGQDVSITWNAAAPGGVVQTRVYLYYADQVDVLKSIAGNPGSYSWKVPNSTFYLTEQAKVRIEAYDALGNVASDSSDAFFAIHDPSAPPPPPWNTPEVVTSTATCGVANCTLYGNIQPALATDAAGDVHLVYVYQQDDYRDGFAGSHYFTERIYYRKRTSGVWGSPQLAVDLGSQTSGYYVVRGLDIAVDSANLPHIAWTWEASASSSDTYSTSYVGGSWRVPTNLSANATYSGYDPSILVSASGDVYVFWRDGATSARSLYYRSHAAASATWTGTSTTLNASNLIEFEARRGQGGRPSVTFVEATGAPKRTAWDGSAWTAPTAFGTCAPNDARYPSMAETSAGAVDTVFYMYDTHGRIDHAYADGVASLPCTKVSIGTSGPSVGPWARVAHDPAALPTVAWIETASPGAVYVRRMTARPSSWSKPVMVNLASQAPQDNHLAYAVGPDAVGHVAWMSYVSGHAEIHYNFGDVSLDTEAPTVNVLAPAAGDVLAAGQEYEVTWTASDAVGVAGITVRVSTDDGANWTEVATGLVGTTSATWNIPAQPLGPVLVQVIASDAAGNEGVASQYATIADATPPVVEVLSPDGGETLEAGQEHAITWTAADDGGVPTVSVYYSTDDGASWIAIVNDVPSTGSLQWTVPEVQTNQARIQVVAVDAASNQGSDSSDAVFTIAAANNPPAQAFGPTPAHLAAGVNPEGAELGWSAADADLGDLLVFDLYFGTSSSLDAGDLVSSGDAEQTYPLGNLVPETTYYWRVDTSDAHVTTTGSVWRFTTGLSGVIAPTNLSAWSTSVTTIDLTWFDAASDETGYEVERKLGVGGTYQTVATLPAGSSQWTDTGRAGSSTYVYRVRAVRGSDASAYSNEAAATTPNTPPLAPSNPSPATGAADQPTWTTLSWTGGDLDPGDNVTYHVFLGTTPSAAEVTAITALSYPPSDLAPGTFYFWRVVATDAQGDSVSSPLWTFVTSAAPPPTPPTVVSATLEGVREVEVAWSGEQTPNDGMRIERRKSADGYFQPVAAGVASPFVDTQVLGHETYTYRARTLYGTGMSNPSVEAIVDVPNGTPVVESTPVTSAEPGSDYGYAIVATDPDFDVVDFALLDGPAGMTVDAVTGVVTWSPTSSDVGAHAVSVSVNDDFGGHATHDWVLVVTAQCEPEPEICGNGVDDDCDAVIDESGDSDGDGVDDCTDNCRDAKNASQRDDDDDGIGNACEAPRAGTGGAGGVGPDDDAGASRADAAVVNGGRDAGRPDAVINRADASADTRGRDAGGCGCRAAGSSRPQPGLAWFLTVLALGLRALRRRPSSRGATTGTLELP